MSRFNRLAKLPPQQRYEVAVELKRRGEGMTQEEVGTLLGVSRNHISNIERSALKKIKAVFVKETCQ